VSAANNAPAPRYALYYSPDPHSDWGGFGSHWVGRCAGDGMARPQPQVRGVDAAEFARLTAAPRRYGFHATLSAPFHLAPGTTREGLVEALQVRLANEQAFDLPVLEATRLDDFIALVPRQADPRIDAIAAICVREFDAWRAPLSEADLTRRRAAGLDAVEDALLVRWGYPWVLERFRPHLSLTGALPAGDARHAQHIIAAAQGLMPKTPARFDAVSVFEEAAPGHDMRILARVALAA